MKKWSDLTPFARGATLMLGAVFTFSVMDTVAKFLTGSYHPVQVVWARYTFQLVFVFLIAAPRLRTLLRTKYPLLQLVRSAFLFGATVCFFPFASASQASHRHCNF